MGVIVSSSKAAVSKWEDSWPGKDEDLFLGGGFEYDEICFIFTPTWGRFPFLHFSNELKPPNR